MTKPQISKKSRRNIGRKAGQKKSFWTWLERKYFVPEFAGGMLITLAIFFFLAATNTLAGWLYVISGVSLALILISAFMPAQILKGVVVKRSLLDPVTAGDQLWVELLLTNRSLSPISLLQVRDLLHLGNAIPAKSDLVIEQLAPGQTQSFFYELLTEQRGIYQFGETQLATASPFGLFRSMRSQVLSQQAIVYPTVLPLSQCPLIDQVGQDQAQRLYSMEHSYRNANEGLTKALRPYRWGDPTRLVHWRSSARFGELRVRELEMTVGGQELAIALDLDPSWQGRDFEYAVIAAASLYFYAQRHELKVSLWTVDTDIVQGDRQVLETLAGIMPQTKFENGSKLDKNPDFPASPLVWLTARASSCSLLPGGSRSILWTDSTDPSINMAFEGLVLAATADQLAKIPPEQFTEQLNYLQMQLQSGLNR